MVKVILGCKKCSNDMVVEHEDDLQSHLQIGLDGIYLSMQCPECREVTDARLVAGEICWPADYREKR